MADIKDSLNLDNIQESTILAIYDDIIDLQILMRYPWVFHYDDIQELVIVDDDWHLNILLILPILSICSFFSVAWYDDIDQHFSNNWQCDDIQH
jgi:hypothetical protein